MCGGRKRSLDREKPMIMQQISIDRWMWLWEDTCILISTRGQNISKNHHSSNLLIHMHAHSTLHSHVYRVPACHTQNLVTVKTAWHHHLQPFISTLLFISPPVLSQVPHRFLHLFMGLVKLVILVVLETITYDL